jgi:hypothetical protein
MSKYSIILSILFFFSCGSKPSEHNKVSKACDSITQKQETDNTKSYESLDFAKAETNPTDTSEYIVINKTMTVMIMPDSAWMSQQQKEAGEDGWNEVVADNEYYGSEAMDSLEKRGIQSRFFESDKRFYKFIRKDKSVYWVDKHKMKDSWGLILFNTGKNPVFWSSTSIDDAIKDIYELNDKK